MSNIASLFTASDCLCTCLSFSCSRTSGLCPAHCDSFTSAPSLVPLPQNMGQLLPLAHHSGFMTPSITFRGKLMLSCFLSHLYLGHISVSVCFLRFSIYSDFFKYRHFTQNTKTLLNFYSVTLPKWSYLPFSATFSASTSTLFTELSQSISSPDLLYSSIFSLTNETHWFVCPLLLISMFDFMILSGSEFDLWRFPSVLWYLIKLLCLHTILSAFCAVCFWAFLGPMFT